MVAIHIFIGCLAFPAQIEKTQAVSKAQLKDLVPQAGLPRSLQSDNRPTFVSNITQKIAASPGISFHLQAFWRLQSLGKVKKAKQSLKILPCPPQNENST